MKRISVAIILCLMMIGSANAACPIGTYEWVDKWGNRICKSFSSGKTNSIQGNTKNCPTGTYQSIDEWGNTICRSFRGNQKYYDTSKDCPIGSYEWVDEWGNSICKKH